MDAPLPRDFEAPDPEAFGRLLAPSTARHRSLKELHALLSACRPEAELKARMEALEKLAGWLRARRRPAPFEGAVAGESAQVSRFRWLVRALELVPAFARALSTTLQRSFAEGVGTRLFARLGLPTDRGFFAETVDRISRGFLPQPRDERDLVELLARVLPREADLRALAATPPELVERLIELLRQATPADPWAPLVAHLYEALALLALRISAVGLSDVLRARSPEGRLADSPFFALPRAVDALLETARHAKDESPERASEVSLRTRECERLMRECRTVTSAVIENLERSGVSVDVVYRLELVERSLVRLGTLIRQFEPHSDLERAIEAKALLGELAAIRLRDRNLNDILRGNLHLLARKIIERAGHTGEHYITSSRGEYVKMLLSAGGGGVLTVGTIVLKYLISSAHFAPFVEGVISGSNYAGSFVLMQLLGFTLATKQPSMTAAALAGTLRESAGRPDLSALVALIARITRSQLAAAIGNIGLVIPAALIFDRFYRLKMGGPYLEEEKAEYVLHSLHPTETGTIFFAAFTGVLLWTSSIAAGWLENWAVYRRLPEAIAEHRFGRFLGGGLFRFASRFLTRNIAGFGGNVTLGFLLGMTPVLGKFFGLPLDVRHVTLSTGSLTLAVSTLGIEAVTTPAAQAAAIGIAIIGTMNFGVSFVLALAVALRAREVERSDRFRLLLSVVVTFLRSPFQFFFPPSAEAAVKVHGPVSVRPPPH